MRSGGDVLVLCTSAMASVIVSGVVTGRATLERRFSKGRFYSSRPGTLIYHGRCDGSPSPSHGCLRLAPGLYRELDASHHGKVARWIPSAQGASAVVVGDRGKKVGVLRGNQMQWLDGEAQERLHKAARQVFEPDRPLDRNATLLADGTLRMWIRQVGQHGFLSVNTDGSASVALRHMIGGVGCYAFMVDIMTGHAFQSHDWGVTFTAVESWPLFRPLPWERYIERVGRWIPTIRRCSDVGCDLGSALRFGWRVLRPPLPPALSFLSKPRTVNDRR